MDENRELSINEKLAIYFQAIMSGLHCFLFLLILTDLLQMKR